VTKQTEQGRKKKMIRDKKLNYSAEDKKLTKSEHSGEAEKKCKNNMVARAEQIVTKLKKRKI
jgi:hypothetical protein